MTKRMMLVFAAVLSLSSSAIRAEDDHAYTFGPVMIVSFIRTQPGKFEDYLRYLDGPYKKLMEESKKQGTIVDYAIWQARPRDPQDADLVLTVTYKNMAAFDGLQARLDPIVKQTFGSLGKAQSAAVDREQLRKEVGSVQVQQLILK
jgi:hypothetical protein